MSQFSKEELQKLVEEYDIEITALENQLKFQQYCRYKAKQELKAVEDEQAKEQNQSH